MEHYINNPAETQKDIPMNWKVHSTITGKTGSFRVCSNVIDDEIKVRIFPVGSNMAVPSFKAGCDIFDSIEVGNTWGESVLETFIKEAESYIKKNL